MTKNISKRNDRKNHEKSESVIDVTDSGSGIDPQLLEADRLFSKFSSNYPSGTGLGLYISKKIIEAHEGRIWAQNNADKKGASFKFKLPLRLSC
jgi:signal transduction histidine kinase